MKLQKFLYFAPTWILFILGMWLIVLQPLGPHLARLPGDLGDTRFNNYILEHFFRWASRQITEYWNAPFFFPFQQTIAFSDNLLGSAPFYAMFRELGFNRETAFQTWYILGYLLNFGAASYVLWRINLKPLAVGAGAFFFSFGLPLLAQENHVQLLYRFCIPLSCLMLWQFFQVPRLRTLVILSIFVVWQFYLTIYMGFFLTLLLGILFILTPFFSTERTIVQRITAWPRRLKEAWLQAHPLSRLVSLSSVMVMFLCFAALLLPYYRVHKNFGFYRGWAEVSEMLPRWQSYLLSDNSKLWKSQASIYSDFPLRHEHQLFPGSMFLIFVLIGIGGHFRNQNRRLAWLNFSAAIVFVALTLEINGFSLYWLMWRIPGMNSVRAVTRSILVVMWPLALYAAWTIDGFMQWSSQRSRGWQLAAYLLVGFLVAESIFYNHTTFFKADAQARLEELRQLMPEKIPPEPILFVASNPQEPFWAGEIDSMLLAQELGWATLNGYSGNSPPGYQSAESCTQLPARIMNYMNFAGIQNQNDYLDFIKRVVPIGFKDCDPTWWEKMP